MKDFSQIYKEDLNIVGKKAVELAELIRLGVPIPDGFVISTIFFKKFLDQTGISQKIREVLKLDHPAIQDSIEKLFDPIKKLIMHIAIPENLTLELHRFYKKLAGQFKDQSLNIFSSSLSNNKSVIFKDVKGDANLILKIKEIWASHIILPVSIVVQKNIQSKMKGTGVTNNPTRELEFIAKKIQKHFYFPKVIEYVVEKGKIYVTQVKPFTGIVVEKQNRIQQAQKLRKVLINGISVNAGIVTGPVKLINSRSFAVKNSEIIVTKNLNKSLYDKIKRAKGVIADNLLQGNIEKLRYRKIIKAPTITGCENAAKLLQNGNIVTVNGVTGEVYAGGLW